MGNKLNIVLYAFIAVCIVKVGLAFVGRYLMEDIVDVHREYMTLENETAKFNHFEDSLAGNLHFRKRLLDTIQNANHLQQVKQNIRKDLEQKINEFDKQYPNRKAMLTTYKIVDGLRILLNILFVCLAFPIFVHLVRTRTWK